MRRFVQALYRIALRGVGAVGVLCLIVFAMFAAGGSDTRALLHPLPIVSLSFLVASSLAFATLQHRLPDAIARPNRRIHIAVVGPVMLVLSLIAPLAVMVTLTGTGGPDELMRPISVGTGALFFGLYWIVGLLGIMLSLWPLPQDGESHRPAPERVDPSNPYARLRRA